MHEHHTDTPMIEARGLGLRTGSGWVYRSVDLSVRSGELALVAGASGSGRTALLLTLAGRMKPSTGRLTVAGEALPGRARRVRRVAGLGVMRAVNELDAELTVDEHLRTQALLTGARGGREARETVLARVGWFGDPSTPAGELHAADRLLVGAALGLLGDPLVLFVDDTDRDLRSNETAAVLEALRSVAETGTTIVATLTDPALAPAGRLAATLAGDLTSDFIARPEAAHALA